MELKECKHCGKGMPQQMNVCLHCMQYQTPPTKLAAKPIPRLEKKGFWARLFGR